MAYRMNDRGNPNKQADFNKKSSYEFIDEKYVSYKIIRNEKRQIEM
jgi:hypothetical protein